MSFQCQICQEIPLYRVNARSAPFTSLIVETLFRPCFNALSMFIEVFIAY